jgi:hypothetical protein
MYVCVCMYIYVCVCVYIYVYVCIYIYIYIVSHHVVFSIWINGSAILCFFLHGTKFHVPCKILKCTELLRKTEAILLLLSSFILRESRARSGHLW